MGTATVPLSARRPRAVGVHHGKGGMNCWGPVLGPVPPLSPPLPSRMRVIALRWSSSSSNAAVRSAADTESWPGPTSRSAVPDPMVRSAAPTAARRMSSLTNRMWSRFLRVVGAGVRGSEGAAHPVRPRETGPDHRRRARPVPISSMPDPAERGGWPRFTGGWARRIETGRPPRVMTTPARCRVRGCR